MPVAHVAVQQSHVHACGADVESAPFFLRFLLDAADLFRNILNIIRWQECVTLDVTLGDCPHNRKRSEER